MNKEKFDNRARLFRNHGITREKFERKELAYDSKGNPNPWYYEQQEIGFNYRITDLQCALGSNQLTKIEQFVSRRNELASQYDELLESVDHVKTLPPIAEGQHAHHLFVVQIDFQSISRTKAEVMAGLKKRGINTQVHYVPIHFQPYYKKRLALEEGELENAEAFYEACLSLPLYPDMSSKDVERVVSELAPLIKG